MRVGIAVIPRRTFQATLGLMLGQLPMVALLWLLLASTASAALVCNDTDAGTSNNTGYFSSCDMTYKNTELMCDINSVTGSCPAHPMMLKTTALKSTIRDFTPWLYAYVRSPEDRNKAYTGTYYRGTPGDATQTYGLVCPPGQQCPASCQARVVFPREASSPEEDAQMVRYQMDNCASQFVLNAALYPYQKEDSFILSGENPNDPSERISLASTCQPLNTVLDTQNEYFASDYLKAAWIKLLQDPSYKKTPGAPLEPTMPAGLRIENPQAPPSPFPHVRVSSIGAVKYEEIVDPTHPFSPRWDFENNERDKYSPLTASYSNDPQNAVFCAGDKNREITKVDILTFREARLKFDDKITDRIDFNKNCKANTGPQKNPCCRVEGEFCTLLPCATCYGMTAASPVCSTNYVTLPDRKKVKTKYLPVHPTLRMTSSWRVPTAAVTAAPWPRTAMCSPNELAGANRHTMADLCRQLRAPFTPLNKLKMRYHNPSEESNIVLKNGVPEGYSFRDFFKDANPNNAAHMPYPRLWDTGRSIQQTDSDQQNPRDTSGQWTSIVGVGHEGTAGNASPPSGTTRTDKAKALRMTDQRCMLGGWGGDVSMGGVSLNVPDPITSWTELKLYQGRTMRDMGLSCLARYEKSFKLGASEEKALQGFGADPSVAIYTRRRADGGYDYFTRAQMKAQGLTPRPTDMLQSRKESFPLAWRGYASAPDEEHRFPNVGGTGTTITGLDNAEVGDIIILENGGNGRGLPKVAKVDIVSAQQGYVYVTESDNGKWPDVCGTTDGWGEMKSRYIYKKGKLPAAARKEYDRIGASGSCDDPHLTACETDLWSSIKIYRPRKDERTGNDGTEMRTPGGTP